MTGWSPFPAHVHSYFYRGKTITLADHVGVDVDMNRDTFQKLFESTETRMREQHFKYATKGMFAQTQLQVTRPRIRKRTKKNTVRVETAVAPQTTVNDVRECSDSESEEEVKIKTDPLKPSQRLLEFLSDHKKGMSLPVLPPVGKRPKQSKPRLKTLRTPARILPRKPTESFHSLLA